MKKRGLIGIWPLQNIPTSTFPIGGFSGLCCVDGDATDGFRLVSLTDRGPNLEPIETQDSERPMRPFVFPEFVPAILITNFSESTGWTFVEGLPLTWADNPSIKVTGIPNSPKDELPVDQNLKALELDRRGIDPEGIAVQDEIYWVVEEYGPSILKVNSSGHILKRWIPEGSAQHRHGIEALPRELSERRVNRGFEGVAISGSTLYAFLQSPLKSNAASICVLAWDTKAERVLELLEYPLHDKNADKIGDVSSLPDGRLLVIEQDGKTKKSALRKVFVWDPKSGDKSLIVDLSGVGYTGREKAEGLAMLSSHCLAVVSDNDFALKSETPSEIALFEVEIPLTCDQAL